MRIVRIPRSVHVRRTWYNVCEKQNECGDNLNAKTAFEVSSGQSYHHITRQYNDSMARLLEQYGIPFQCIERLQAHGEYISAATNFPLE